MTARKKTPAAKTAPKPGPAKVKRRRVVPKARPQYAALPYRLAEDVEILLITSRETGRWVIPKGWPMKGRTPAEAAAREAFEEAGVIGEIAPAPFGAYPYVKYLKSGLGRPCKVKVFPLRVVKQQTEWPEMHQRSAQWFGWAEAAAAVQELRLSRIIRKFGKRAGRGAVA
ncbi:MAG: NUDIX hydrolase [Caulobacteraceae bacterium]